MAQRSYQDACGAARAMDLIGERWALLIVRELVFGPKRFGDLRAGLPKASQNVLSQRLRELEQSGIVRRVQLGPPASVHAYELTERGRLLESTLIELSRWGAGLPDESDGEMSTDAFMLLLKALYRPPTGEPLTARLGLRVGTDAFDVGVRQDTITVVRGRTSEADVTVTGTVAALRDLMFGGTPVRSAISRGAIEVQGDIRVAERFFPLFSPPTDDESG
ncbi:winged helix-turn-helix transcriptional regulator [Micromonospora sp. RHAY321]|uniref:winged helix-turn-helix transcriptional regulator n=1 Tax=Micromonospora sp. RHAY321 TaxID=2944807 RepID=UPI00207CEF64|nr:winged helix-turn-helix transcriptional regulator [Micromonospora sp. RHAY321]MCO1596175.1 winged helix-turn-helix transcriptional regulator [Micromonospora sp. RHAY321]